MITAADIMTDADVAKLAGVSVDTFQRSLRDGIKAGELGVQKVTSSNLVRPTITNQALPCLYQ